MRIEHGRCTCSAADPCPLGRVGNDVRCTERELRDALAVTEEAGVLKIVPRKGTAMHQRRSVADNLQELKRVRDIQGQPGNWNYDPYMQGMYNGLELAAAIMENREPVYKDAPPRHGKPWLCNVSTPTRKRRVAERLRRFFRCRLDIAKMHGADGPERG